MWDEKSRVLLSRVQSGDDTAAEELFHRYVARLLPLARNRLSMKLTRKVDPEDVVQSAFRSFFRAAREGRYVLEQSGDLWRLLAAITVNKVHRQVEHHQADKRAADAEASIGNNSLLGVAPENICREPTPEDAAILTEELQAVMSELMHLHREMLELHLQGAGVEEIARQKSRTQHQVRRVLKKVRERLEQTLQESAP